MTKPLTGPQAKMLRILADAPVDKYGDARPIPPRGVAKAMWPDSVGWSRRTRKYGTNDPGALGGTMPMKAATVLWRLQAMGYADRAGASYDHLANLWTITPAGRDALAAYEGKHP